MDEQRLQAKVFVNDGNIIVLTDRLAVLELV
jgi:hypothetical protein